VEAGVQRLLGVPGVVEELRITWLGHSTVLVESAGVRVLTDPVLRPRLLHLRRVDGGAVVPRDVDAVLVSHAHYDHLDVRSLRLVGAPTIVVPKGARHIVAKARSRTIVELEAGEQISIGGLAVRATPAAHDGRRHPLAPVVPPLGFLLTGSTRVYFAGDTDLFEGMRDLAEGLDLALLPISGWGPRVPAGHLDPRRAAEALRLLRPRVAIPIHWGTYRRRGMPSDPQTLRGPADEFETLAAGLAPDVTVARLEPGRLFDVPARVGTGAES
jgi:L-ascorbate metabolism protein UlaG (beta-lactamase superfamily)